MKPTTRLTHIDWLRGLACLLMFQTHAYDSWLAPEARRSSLYRWSQLLGTLPAPLFLFLAGVSAGLVILRQSEGGVEARHTARQLIRRGAQIFGLGLLFRLQEFLLGQPSAPWSDLFRVDILNTIGLSLAILGSLYGLVQRRLTTAVAAGLAGLGVSVLTPLLWTQHRPEWLPWMLESYVNGVHIYGYPQPWLFPLFPWSGFALCGLATGLFVFSASRQQRPWRTHLFAGLVGVGLLGLGVWSAPWWERLYRVSDFWHSSPAFFLLRWGVLLLLLTFSFLWCRLVSHPADPFVLLGRHSLLVYWVHIEFVYGRFSLLPKRGTHPLAASLGLMVVTAAMILLAWGQARRVHAKRSFALPFLRPADRS